MMGLRLREGVSMDWVNDHIPQDDVRWETINNLQQINMLEIHNHHLKLTSQGLFVGDAVIAELL